MSPNFWIVNVWLIIPMAKSFWMISRLFWRLCPHVNIGSWPSNIQGILASTHMLILHSIPPHPELNPVWWLQHMSLSIVVDKKLPLTYIRNHFSQKCTNIAYVCLQTKERKKLEQLLRGIRRMWFLAIHSLLVCNSPSPESKHI